MSKLGGSQSEMEAQRWAVTSVARQRLDQIPPISIANYRFEVSGPHLWIDGEPKIQARHIDRDRGPVMTLTRTEAQELSRALRNFERQMVAADRADHAIGSRYRG